MPPIIPQSLQPPKRASTIASLKASTKAVPKPPTPEEIKKLEAQYQKEYFQKEAAKVDVSIKAQEKRLKDYQNRIFELEKDGIASEEKGRREEYKDEVALISRELTGLRKGKELILQGKADSQYAKEYASQKASELYRRKQFRKKTGMTPNEARKMERIKRKAFYRSLQQIEQSKARTPTAAEKELKMSLPPEIRNLPAQSVKDYIDNQRIPIAKPPADPRVLKEFKEKEDTRIKEPTFEIYGGLKLPYGAKDIPFTEERYGTLGYEQEPYRKTTIFSEMKEREFRDKDIILPAEVLYQREAERIEKELYERLSKEYLKKIESGALKEEEANKLFKEEFSKAFEAKFDKSIESSKFKTKLKQSESLRESFEESFDPDTIKRNRLRRVETVTDISAGLISTGAPAFGLAYFGAKGFYKAAKGAEQDVRIADLTPSGELKTPLYMGLEPSAQSREAGVELLFAGASSLNIAQNIKPTSITKGRLRKLEEAQWTLRVKEVVKQKDKTLLKVAGSKGIQGGMATAEVDMVIPVKIADDGTFILEQGKGVLKYNYIDFKKQIGDRSGLVKKNVNFRTGGRGSTKRAVIRTDVGDIVIDDVQTFVSSGEGYVALDTIQDVTLQARGGTSSFWSAMAQKPVAKKTKVSMTGEVTDDVNQFIFGGSTAKSGEEISFVSGRAVRMRIYKRDPIKLTLKESGRFEPTGRFTLAYKQEAKGDFVQLKEPIEDAGTYILGGGKKSSKEFLQSLYPPQSQSAEVVAGGLSFAGGVAPSVEKPVIKEISKKFAKESAQETTRRASIYTGLGVYETTAGGLVAPGLKDSKPTSVTLGDYNTSTGVDISLSPSLTVSTSQKIDETQSLKRANLFSPGVGFKPLEDVKSDVALGSSFGEPVKQSQKSGQTFAPGFLGTPLSTPITTPGFAPGGGFGGFLFPGEGFGKGRKEEVVGYHAYALEGGKYKKVTQKPHTKRGAFDVMARVVDNTISAQGKVEPIKVTKKGKASKKKASKGKLFKRGDLQQGDGYYMLNKDKFRNYKVANGKRVQLNNKLIEKKNRRLDTPGETRRATVAQTIARRRKVSLGLPTRKKKGGSRFRL